MSGLEVAGLVLGAFPLAFTALDKYKEVAKRMGLFYKIRLEYNKVRNELDFHKLAFKGHLRQLLLPLVMDDDQIKTLLEDPGGASWKEMSIAELLESRLQESFSLYMSFVEGMERVMKDIIDELALEDVSVQEKLNTSGASTATIRLKSSITKDGRAFQLYRLKFSNRANVRKQLFTELQDYNNGLGKLLDSSDKDTQLTQKRSTSTHVASIDAAICQFWIQARSVFRALALAWTCRCQQHEARLLLQHRASKDFDVEVTFTKPYSSSELDIYRTRISDRGEPVTSKSHGSIHLIEHVPIRQNNHSPTVPVKSALKGKNVPTRKVSILKYPPSITFMDAQYSSSLQVVRPINNLCAALEQFEDSPCGYLLEDERRYYVYTINRQRIDANPSVTLAMMVSGAVQPPPTRKQRYNLSLILASSFLQLLESPWMPTSFKATDISFYTDPSHPKVLLLDQPHITRYFLPSNSNTNNGYVTDFTDALDDLGIILLELCFGKALQAQVYRQDLPPGQTEIEKGAYDVLAARKWQRDVNEEAGFDYAQAVGWCLGGNRSTPPERWRQCMLKQVIQPLQRCRDYLKRQDFTSEDGNGY